MCQWHNANEFNDTMCTRTLCSIHMSIYIMHMCQWHNAYESNDAMCQWHKVYVHDIMYMNSMTECVRVHYDQYICQYI